MTDIMLTVYFTDRPSKVYISNPYGIGTPSWHISIDGYHSGRVWKTEHFGWQFDQPSKGTLTKDDFDAIIDLLEATGDPVLQF